MLGTLVAGLVLVMMQRSSASYLQVLSTDRRIVEMALTIQADKAPHKRIATWPVVAPVW